jgi:hypothetical protein
VLDAQAISMNLILSRITLDAILIARRYDVDLIYTGLV